MKSWVMKPGGAIVFNKKVKGRKLCRKLVSKNVQTAINRQKFKQKYEDCADYICEEKAEVLSDEAMK